MKAIVYTRYGTPDVLELQEIEKPTPKEDEVLVKVRASSVNPLQWHTMTGLFLARIGNGLTQPTNTRLGSDFAGVIEAVGSSVTRFKPGDEVFGGRGGSFAEYLCIRAEHAIARKPANVTFEQAAAVPTAGITALQGLRDYGQIQPGQKVLINGAAGGVGTFAVQIAKAFGAEVTAVCSTRNIEMVRSLGADQVIDYTRQDFTLGPQCYDLFLDVVGSRSWRECRRILNPNAKFVIVGGPKTNRWIGPLAHVLKVRLASLRASQKVTFFVAEFKRDDFEVLRELLETGKVRAIVERTYPWNEIAEAMRYLGTGHTRAKIVVTIGDTNTDIPFMKSTQMQTAHP